MAFRGGLSIDKDPRFGKLTASLRKDLENEFPQYKHVVVNGSQLASSNPRVEKFVASNISKALEREDEVLSELVMDSLRTRHPTDAYHLIETLEPFIGKKMANEFTQELCKYLTHLETNSVSDPPSQLVQKGNKPSATDAETKALSYPPRRELSQLAQSHRRDDHYRSGRRNGSDGLGHGTHGRPRSPSRRARNDHGMRRKTRSYDRPRYLDRSRRTEDRHQEGKNSDHEARKKRETSDDGGEESEGSSPGKDRSRRGRSRDYHRRRRTRSAERSRHRHRGRSSSVSSSSSSLSDRSSSSSSSHTSRANSKGKPRARSRTR